MAGSAARMESTWLMTCLVRSTDVAGGMEMVQNTVPVSSSGTSPVLVVNMVATRATMPMTTTAMMAAGLRTSFSMMPLYRPCTLP